MAGGVKHPARPCDNQRMRVARRYILSGRVQGVGFRYFTQDAARCEGLHGHVTNQVDGTVEVRAEGEADALERFERKLRQGPSRSRVERVTIDEVEPTALSGGFFVR